MRTGRIDGWLLAALAAAGALVAHGVGYGLGAAAPATSHGHLAVLGPVVLGVAGVAALVVVLPWVRRAPGYVTVRHLVLAQVGAYLALELVEAALADPVAHLSSPAFVLGLLVHPVVAVVVARIVRAGVDLVRAALRGRRARPGRCRALALGAAPSWRTPVPFAGAPRFRRGPPVVFVP